MASTTHRMGKKGKQQTSHTGYRSGAGGGGRDYHNSHTTTGYSMPNLPGVYSNPDMAFALVNIVGCVVDVSMQSGTVYQGVLKAVSPKLSVALALAHDKTSEMNRSNTEKLMQLDFADIVSVSVLPESNPNLNSRDIFKTDSEISRSNGPSLSRELQPFSFEEDSQSSLHLDDGSTGWTAEEMFETNRSKFNVESSYDEEMTEYTTKLDRSDTKDYHEREERAAKIAMEIESSVGSQRNKKLEDGSTEEELFSSVVRYGSSFPPLSSSASSSTTAAKTGRGGPDQTRAESSSTSPPMNGLVPRVAVAASSQPSTTLQDPQHRPSLSSATSSSSLSSATEPSGSQDGAPSFSYLAAVVNGRTSPSGGTKVEDSNSRGSGMEASPRAAETTNIASSQNTISTMETMSQESMSCSVSGVAAMEEAAGDVYSELADKQNMENVEKESVRHSTTSGHSPLVPVEEQVQAVIGTSPTEAMVEGEGFSEKSAAVPETSSTSVSPTPSESDVKEKKVKSFTLNPAAKEFNPKAKEFVPRSELPPSSQSSSPIHSDPPSHRHIASHPPNSGGKQRYPKPHGRGNYPSQEHGVYSSSPYIFNQASQQVPGMVRSPLHQGQGMQFSPQHFQPSYPPAANSFIPPQGMVNSAQVLAAPNQKFYGDMVPGAVYPGQQQYPVPVPQHMLQQPHSLTGPLLTSVSQQPGLPTSHGSLVGGAPASGAVVFMQGAQPLGSNPPMYPQMMLPQVGNQATNPDMIGGQPYYQ